MKHDFNLGYVMGLIVGEGSFTLDDGKYLVLSVKLHEDDPQPLRDLRETLGGCIYGPYAYAHKDGGIRRYRIWRLRSTALKRILPTLRSALPKSRKRKQLDTILATLAGVS